MDIFIILRIFIKRLWILIVIPVIIIITTFFLTSKLPPKYKSTAQLSTGFTTNDKIQVTEQNVNLREASVKFSNLIETINSEVILTLLSYKLLIHDFESTEPFRGVKINSFTDSLTIEQKQRYLRLAKEKYEKMELLSPYEELEQGLISILGDRSYLGWQLKPDLSVFRVRDTDFIKIQYISGSPFLSAFVVNTVGEEYIRYENSLNENFSGESVDFFKKQMNEKRIVLQEKTEAYDNFLSSNGLLGSGVESDAKISQISEYELLEREAESDVQRLSISLQNVSAKLGSSVQNVDKAATNRKILQIREKINELTSLYRSSGSTDSTLADTIQKLRIDLQIQMDQLSASSATADGEGKTKAQLISEKEDLELKLNIARQNLQSIRSNLARLKANISGYASNEASLQGLRREMDKATEDFNDAEQRYNRELDKSKVAGTSVRMVIQGQPNGNPESSKRWLIIIMAGMGSFGFCAFVIVVLEFVDMRLKTPAQFKKLTKLELSGSIPLVSVKGLELINLFSTTTQSKEKETFKHFLRKLRYELEKDVAQVYLITSNKQSEGKSFIIMCLAFTLSLIKKNVLIIDTNFKNNSLTQALLHTSNKKRIDMGRFLLSSDNTSKATENNEDQEDDEYANSIVSKTPHKQIFIIGNTGEQASPSEIFAGKDFDKMLAQLRTHYDYIFLEGPALNEYSDTHELVSYVDKVLPLFASESTIKQLDKESISYLKSLDGKLMGAVLNKVELKDLKV